LRQWKLICFSKKRSREGSITGSGRSGGADGLGIAEGRRARGRVAGRGLEGAVAPCSFVLLLLLDLAAAHLLYLAAGGIEGSLLQEWLR